MDLLKTFAERLLGLREDMGDEYSRQRVANDLRITRASLEYYEKGLRMPDIEKLSMIADYYNVSADYLLGRTDVRNTDRSIHSVSECTGISEKAAEKLCTIGKKYISVTMFLEDEGAEKLFAMLNEVIMNKFYYRFFDCEIRERLKTNIGELCEHAADGNTDGFFKIEFDGSTITGVMCYEAMKALLAPMKDTCYYKQIYDELSKSEKYNIDGDEIMFGTDYELPDISEHNSVCEFNAWKEYVAISERICSRTSLDKELTELYNNNICKYILEQIELIYANSFKIAMQSEDETPLHNPKKDIRYNLQTVAFYRRLMREWFDIYTENKDKEEFLWQIFTQEGTKKES
jgi:transcriptional regulator with XRE-family HTH domain